jgi:hypothetical protein
MFTNQRFRLLAGSQAVPATLLEVTKDFCVGTASAQRRASTLAAWVYSV